MVPAVLTLLALGCVNLDKPQAVAECSAGIGGPCTDDGNRDAALPRIDARDALGPDALADVLVAVPDADAQPLPDGPADAEGRSDGSDLVAPDLLPDTQVGPRDTIAADNRPGDDLAADRPGDLASPDALPDVAPDAGSADTTDTGDAPGLPDAPPDTAPGPDTADGPTNKPDVATTVVTIKSGRGDGVMTGYGWVTLGASDTVTSPTCGTSNTPITSASPCATSTNWSSSTALCVTGSIPALPEVPTATDYANNWGIQVGVNAKDPNAAIGQAFTTIALNISGTPLSGLRIELHRAGDAVGTTYCARWTSSDPVPLTSFNTACWNNGGTYLTAADAATIDKVGLQVTSGAAAITVTNLCIASIVFGK
jgi:hypothetical protein